MADISKINPNGTEYNLKDEVARTTKAEAIEITITQYEALSTAEKNDPTKIYFITDYPASVGALNDLSDVDITTPTKGQILTYDDTDDEWKNTDVDDIAPTVTEASTRANLSSGDSLKTIIGKIKKFFSDLKAVAFTGAYADLSGTPTIPTVNNGTLTIKRNNTSVGTFTANQSSASNINIECATPSDVEGSKTATGSIVTVTDAADIYAEEVDVAVECTQTGSGTPSPSNIRPIQGYDIVSVDRCGKNLWDSDGFLKADGWVKNSDDSYSGNVNKLVYHTYNANTNCLHNALNYSELGENYTVSFNVSANSGLYFGFDIIDISTGTIRNVQVSAITETSIVLSTDCSANERAMAVWFSYSKDKNVTLSNFQLEIGSTSPTYEPYKGKTITYQLGNKNLLPMTVEGMKSVNTSGTWSGNVYSINNGTVTVLTDANGLVTGIKANGTFNANTVFSIARVTTSNMKGQSYILSGITASVSKTALRLSDNTKYAWDASVSGTSITIPSDVASESLMFLFCESGAALSNQIFYPMLRSASVTDPTFSPYNPTLGGMVYGGQLTLNDDGSAVFVGDRAFDTFNGSNWTDFNQYGNTWCTDHLLEHMPAISSRKYKCITNMFETDSSGICNVVGCYDDNSDSGKCTIEIFGASSYFADKADMVAKLNANPLQIAYKLATPFTIRLSAEQLKLLQGTNNVWSNAGNVTLKYQPDNVIAEPKADVQRLRDDVDDRLVGNACRNIFDPTKLAGKYDSGFTSNYDAITHKLTLTGKWYGKWICRVEPNTDYTFSAIVVSGTITASFGIYTSDGSVFNDIIITNSFNNKSDFTFNSGDTNYVAILLYSGNNSSGTTILQNIQLEIGSSPTPYEEYYPSNRELASFVDSSLVKCNPTTDYAGLGSKLDISAYADDKPIFGYVFLVKSTGFHQIVKRYCPIWIMKNWGANESSVTMVQITSYFDFTLGYYDSPRRVCLEAVYMPDGSSASSNYDSITLYLYRNY